MRGGLKIQLWFLENHITPFNISNAYFFVNKYKDIYL